MKKKMGIAVTVIAIVIVAVLSAAYFFRPKEEIKAQKLEGATPIELVGIVENEEEAKKLAESYGIVLVRYAEGIATYQTIQTYDEIKKIEKEKGLPELSINEVNKVF